MGTRVSGRLIFPTSRILSIRSTGATDGIGKGFAEELCERNFNIVIHGRNEQKLEALKRSLEQRSPGVEVRTLQIDAGNEASKDEAFARAASAVKDINLKILINNVGGSGGLASFRSFQERSSSEVSAFLDINARFPTEITRSLLPHLRTQTSALVLNIGSSTSEFGLPYLGVYSGCKAYNKGWSQSLAAEMKAERADVEVMCVLVSAVATDNAPRDLSLTVPSARQMARYSLHKVGCGQSVVFGYWAHALQAAIFDSLPKWIREKAVIDIGKMEKAEEEKRMNDA